MAKKKGLFIVVWSDDDEAYIFHSLEDAIDATRGDLRALPEAKMESTTARIFDFSTLKPVREMGLKIIIRGDEE